MPRSDTNGMTAGHPKVAKSKAPIGCSPATSHAVTIGAVGRNRPNSASWAAAYDGPTRAAAITFVGVAPVEAWFYLALIALELDSR